MAAVIYQIPSGGDQCLILDTRQAFIYPFTAPNWTDLRFGYFMSICQPLAANNGLTSGLGETLTTSGTQSDRFWIGIKDSSTALPVNSATQFIGWSNRLGTDNSTSSIVSTFSSNNYWTETGSSGIPCPVIFDGTTFKIQGSTAYLMFPQVAANVGGNALLSMFKLTRPTGSSLTVTATWYSKTIGGQGCYSGLFTSSPTIAAIRAEFRNLPAYG